MSNPIERLRHQTGVWVEFRQITPETARRMESATKIKNRGISQKKVDDYKNLMRDGQWKINGESIKIDCDNNIIDGQHRIRAIIESGVPCEFVVVGGLGYDEAFGTFDRGRSRNLIDDLHIKGFDRAAKLASAVSALHRHHLFVQSGSITDNATAYSSVSLDLALELIRAYPLIKVSMSAANEANKDVALIRPAGISSLWTLFSEASPEDANEFVSKLGSGEGLESTNPIMALRRCFIRASQSRAGSGGFSGNVQAGWQMANTVVAWNRWRQGQPVTPGATLWRSDSRYPQCIM